MADATGVAALALGQTVGAYAFFLPSLREVRQAPPTDPLIRGDVRLGQVAAGALSIGIGAIMANLTGSTVPLLVAVFIAAIISVIYEFALRGERILET